ncbi:N-acetylglutamate synthase, GNAT family [Dyadobacter koreensis]|uniref:N-acetylglutamate synthase, GNAT family n=1 Tax=Dyadobacter koreensis TaxID=408657 RepID=A0A1H6XXM1_9BACT|nr:GNAT family N-acetyltransferase [Dyadobacter koreensis]SEJ33771.1 N-acetylglutamate synthase, GNAT family [Dyadobacter koreensis]
MPSFSIKHGTLSDIPVVIGIQEKTWEPTYREILSPDQIDYMFEKIYSPEALENQMTEGGQQFLLLFDSEVPVGFAAVAQGELGYFKLHKIYVLPNMQGTGAGKYLLAEVEQYVKSVGGKKLALNVNRYNKARSFYEKMNFVTVKEVDVPIGPYWMNDFIMLKQLEP